MKLDCDCPQTKSDPAISDELQQVLVRLERAARLWRGRRHSQPEDQESQDDRPPLALLARTSQS